MELNEVEYGEGRPIDGYGPGFFRVAGEVLRGGTLVLPTRAAGWQGYDDTATLIAAAEEMDVLLVGTGPEIAPIPAAFRQALEGAGVGVEMMATPSACRTYNVLLGEGRRVGAALHPV